MHRRVLEAGRSRGLRRARNDACSARSNRSFRGKIEKREERKKKMMECVVEDGWIEENRPVSPMARQLKLESGEESLVGLGGSVIFAGSVLRLFWRS